MDDDLGTLAERQELVRDLGELRLVAQVVERHAVDPGRPLVDLALGVDVEMEVVARQAAVDDLHATDLDDPVSVLGLESGGFRIQG